MNGALSIHAWNVSKHDLIINRSTMHKIIYNYIIHYCAANFTTSTRVNFENILI